MGVGGEGLSVAQTDGDAALGGGSAGPLVGVCNHCGGTQRGPRGWGVEGGRVSMELAPPSIRGPRGEAGVVA